MTRESSGKRILVTGSATGIGAAAVGMLSDGARFITGQLISIDGGLVMVGA